MTNLPEEERPTTRTRPANPQPAAPAASGVAPEAPETAGVTPEAPTGDAGGSGMLLPPAPVEVNHLEEEHDSDPALLKEFPWLTDSLPDSDEEEASDGPVLPSLEELAPVGVCKKCGGDVGPDGYCLTCGARMATEREHFAEEPSTWVGGVCDRGLVHLANEDAMALSSAEAIGQHAVLVVCDGVSASTGSDVAALAAARAARDLLATAPTKGDGPDADEALEASILASLVQAVKVAGNKVVSHTNPDSPSPASCTFVAGVVFDGVLYVANIGDSRAYWVPDSGEPVQLSSDHSLAEEAMARGIERKIAEHAPGAHTLTRWLGMDAPALDPALRTHRPGGPGWLLVCSDGLWNYASEPGDIAALLAETPPTEAVPPVERASRLVDWANQQGGHDNVTAALARLDGPAPAASQTTPDQTDAA